MVFGRSRIESRKRKILHKKEHFFDNFGGIFTLRFPYGLRAGKLSEGPSRLHQLQFLSFFPVLLRNCHDNITVHCYRHTINCNNQHIHKKEKLTCEAAPPCCSLPPASWWRSRPSCSASGPWALHYKWSSPFLKRSNCKDILSFLLEFFLPESIDTKNLTKSFAKIQSVLAEHYK